MDVNHDYFDGLYRNVQVVVESSRECWLLFDTCKGSWLCNHGCSPAACIVMARLMITTQSNFASRCTSRHLGSVLISTTTIYRNNRRQETHRGSLNPSRWPPTPNTPQRQRATASRSPATPKRRRHTRPRLRCLHRDLKATMFRMTSR